MKHFTKEFFKATAICCLIGSLLFFLFSKSITATIVFFLLLILLNGFAEFINSLDTKRMRK